MSIVGILSSNLFSAAAQQIQNKQNGGQGAQKKSTNFQELQTEFQQLGQDLQSGNLTQARQDYAALSQSVSGSTQNSSSPVLQAFAQLGKDLQAGNLQAAQQDYTTVQQDAQQTVAQARGHHGRHHHHAGNVEQAFGAQVTASQQKAIDTAFGTLGQDLQAGNLSAAQSAFATLSSDLRQIGGFAALGSSQTSGQTSGATAPAISANLNVSA